MNIHVNNFRLPVSMRLRGCSKAGFIDSDDGEKNDGILLSLVSLPGMAGTVYMRYHRAAP